MSWKDFFFIPDGIIFQNDFAMNIERLTLVRHICDAHPSTEPWTPKGYLHKQLPIYYCKIPKVASTFMEPFLPKVFLSDSLQSSFTVIENIQTPEVKHLEKQRIPDSFSYVFVREPYSRLFSAYENKLFLPNRFWRLMGKDIVRTLRGSNMALTTGHDVNFSEFLQYIVTKYRSGKALNEHLEPMHTRCDPCTVKFDFIGKLETMGPNIESLVDTLQSVGFIDKSVAEKSAREIEAETRNSQWFRPVKKLFEIAKQNNPELNRRQLFLRTWASYQIRGVILKEFEMPYIHDVIHVTENEYRDSLARAIDNSKERKDELKTQREEALIQAYRTVPLKLMQELRTFV